MLYNLKIFWLFSKYIIKKTFEEKTALIFFILAKLLRFSLFFLFAYFLVTKSKLLSGYKVDHVIFFYLTFNIIDTATQALYREVYRLQWFIYSGGFDSVLVRPFNPILRVLLGGIDIIDLILLIPYISLAVFFAVKLDVISLANFVLYLSLLISSFFIATAFHIFIVAIGIITAESNQLLWLYRDVTTLGRFPFDVYREPIKGIFTFVVPVGIMMTFPPKALFGILSLPMVFLSFFLAFSLFFLSLKTWSLALKKYQSWGG